MKNIALVNYGMGNLHSVGKALEKAGGNVRLVENPESLVDVERIVLPGVGAFRDCAGALSRTGLDEALIERINAGTPYLGICLGMQVLMETSFEFGRHNGLGLIPGIVKAFPASHPEKGFKIPHMGWNNVVLSSELEPHPVLAPLIGNQAYYVHSYVCVPSEHKHILAACSYGAYPFAAAIGRENIVGVQFHPEKSQRAGLALLEAFVHWNP